MDKYLNINILSFILLLWGCNSVCDGVECNNGNCADGECVCLDGYEGDDCSLTANGKFSGAYVYTRICESSNNPFQDSVTVAPVTGTTDRITFSGLDGFGELSAVLKFDGVEFQISRQEVGGGISFESISGTISTDAATINLNYKLWDNAADTVLDRCSGSMVK